VRFWRVLWARPSGLTVGTSQRSAGPPVTRRKARITGSPAHSLPWMQPTTSTRMPAGLPARSTTIGRPSDECPMRCTGAAAPSASVIAMTANAFI